MGGAQKKIQFGLLFLLSFSFSNVCIASKKPWLVGIRGYEAKTQSYSETIESKILPTKTTEFSNGNTFVRFLKNPINQKLTLYIPNNIEDHDDLLMEALIKVRTAKTMGALSISVHFESESLPSTFVLKLFKISGAESYRIANQDYDFPEYQTKTKNFKKKFAIVGDTNPSLRDTLSKQLNIPVIQESEWNPNNKKLSGYNIFYVSSLESPINKSFFDTLHKIYSTQSKWQQVHLISPYLPYARSDKIDQFGITVTGRLTADLIEGLGVKTITIVRPHAPQSVGFFSIPVFEINGRETINKELKKLGVSIIVSPDAGFQKDATLYAEELHLPLAIINKKRNPLTGETRILGISGDSVKGHTVAIVDDETASGGTLAESAEFLKKHGANKIFGVVSHLAGNAQKAIDSPDIDLMVVTNSFNITQPDISVLNLGFEISETLQSVFSGEKKTPLCKTLFIRRKIK